MPLSNHSNNPDGSTANIYIARPNAPSFTYYTSNDIDTPNVSNNNNNNGSYQQLDRAIELEYGSGNNAHSSRSHFLPPPPNSNVVSNVHLPAPQTGSYSFPQQAPMGGAPYGRRGENDSTSLLPAKQNYKQENTSKNCCRNFFWNMLIILSLALGITGVILGSINRGEFQNTVNEPSLQAVYKTYDNGQQDSRRFSLAAISLSNFGEAIVGFGMEQGTPSATSIGYSKTFPESGTGDDIKMTHVNMAIGSYVCLAAVGMDGSTKKIIVSTVSLPGNGYSSPKVINTYSIAANVIPSTNLDRVLDIFTVQQDRMANRIVILFSSSDRSVYSLSASISGSIGYLTFDPTQFLLYNKVSSYPKVYASGIPLGFNDYGIVISFGPYYAGGTFKTVPLYCTIYSGVSVCTANELSTVSCFGNQAPVVIPSLRPQEIPSFYLQCDDRKITNFTRSNSVSTTLTEYTIQGSISHDSPIIYGPVTVPVTRRAEGDFYITYYVDSKGQLFSTVMMFKDEPYYSSTSMVYGKWVLIDDNVDISNGNFVRCTPGQYGIHFAYKKKDLDKEYFFKTATITSGIKLYTLIVENEANSTSYESSYGTLNHLPLFALSDYRNSKNQLVALYPLSRQRTSDNQYLYYSSFDLIGGAFPVGVKGIGTDFIVSSQIPVYLDGVVPVSSQYENNYNALYAGLPYYALKNGDISEKWYPGAIQIGYALSPYKLLLRINRYGQNQ